MTIYEFWARFPNGFTIRAYLCHQSYDYLNVIAGLNDCQRVTLWTQRNEPFIINLLDVSAWTIRATNKNPLNTAEYYDNPLS